MTAVSSGSPGDMTEAAAVPSSPVYVIGGFLGAGKTTLLKRLLAHELDRGRRPAVLMNEFGSHDVDSELLHEHPRSGDLELDALLGGCVCCDLSGELPQRLRSLLDRAPGQPVFVETTGLASTDRVVAEVDAALADGKGEAKGRLASVVVVVDVPRFAPLEKRWVAGRSHLRAAQVVLLNKVDEAPAGAVSLVERRVRRLNPAARILRTSFAEAAPEVVLEARPSPAIARAAGPADSTAGYQSIACRPLGPVDEKKLRALLGRYRRSLVRLKGAVRLVGRRGLHEVQWVPGRLALAPYSGPRRRSQLVIIGRRLPWERFFEGLGRCVVRRRRRSGPRRAQRG